MDRRTGPPLRCRHRPPPPWPARLDDRRAPPQWHGHSVRALRDACTDDAAREADVVVAELPWLWRSRLPKDLDLRIPAWVSQEVRAPEGKPLEVPAAVRKEAMRHTRREGYAVDVCRQRARQRLLP
jgi:hypothetical protein